VFAKIPSNRRKKTKKNRSQLEISQGNIFGSNIKIAISSDTLHIARSGTEV